MGSLRSLPASRPDPSTKRRQQLVGSSSRLLTLLEDEEVTDILINGIDTMYLERGGVLEPAAPLFHDLREVTDLIERMVLPLGRRVDAAQPYLDGRLSDGTRFHLILPPIAPAGPLISLRKARSPSSVPLERFAPSTVTDHLKRRVREGDNMLIAGGTGAGKTTLLSRLLDLVADDERIAVIEECSEISSTHPHLVRLEARPPSPDGTGQVTLRALVRNSLRMRPSRLILGECRGEEAFDLLQAMNTGHPGSLCTLHANSAADALRRFEGLVLLSGLEVPLRTVREWVAAAIQRVVFIRRYPEGRAIEEVACVDGIHDGEYRLVREYVRN